MRGKATFDWQIREDTPQEEPELPASAEPRPPRGRWATLLGLTGVVLAALGIVGQQIARRAEANLARVEGELAAAAEAQAWLARREALYQTLAPLPPPWREAAGQAVTVPAVEVQQIELVDNLAMVDLRINAPEVPWYSGPYRQVRVYRDEPDGWRPTRPIGSLWGEQTTHTTAFFRIEFGERDQATVRAMARSLDLTYLQLRRDLGLPLPSPYEQMTIRLVVGPGFDQDLDIGDLRFGGSTLLAPPPELLPRPASMPLAPALHQAISLPLAVKTFAEARGRYTVPCEWRSLANGLGLFLRWEGKELPSRRRWEQEQKLSSWLDDLGPPRLEHIIAVGQDCWNLPSYMEIEAPVYGRPVPRPELAATLIEYGVQAHGRQVLPALLRGFARYEGWEELAPAVFGVEPAELEAGWQEYLAAR